tara:strand:- start:8074 stop:8322 length:249 start_codon:yes stop_codon:yes gene_type:complete
MHSISGEIIMGTKKNLESKVTTSVKDLIDFIKIQAQNNIVEQTRELDVERSDLQKICRIVDMSITASFLNGIDNVVKQVTKD